METHGKRIKKLKRRKIRATIQEEREDGKKERKKNKKIEEETRGRVGVFREESLGTSETINKRRERNFAKRGGVTRLGSSPDDRQILHQPISTMFSIFVAISRPPARPW